MELLAAEALIDPIRVIVGAVGEVRRRDMVCMILFMLFFSLTWPLRCLQANQDVDQIIDILPDVETKVKWLLARLVEFQSCASVRGSRPAGVALFQHALFCRAWLAQPARS